MGREINRLKPITITKITNAGRYADGGGLYLDDSAAGAKKGLLFLKSVAVSDARWGLAASRRHHWRPLAQKLHPPAKHCKPPAKTALRIS